MKKVQNDKQQSTKHKTNDRVTRTPLKIVCEEDNTIKKRIETSVVPIDLQSYPLLCVHPSYTGTVSNGSLYMLDTTICKQTQIK